MWVKRKFVLWQHRYNNLLTEKKSKKVYVSEAINFWKNAVISISINFLQTPYSDYILGGNLHGQIQLF